MPELPEAETIARGLHSVLPGRVIASVTILRDDVVKGPPRGFAAALPGRQFRDVGRRGKNVVFTFEDGSRLVINLGMTGRILSGANSGQARRATHPAVHFHLADGGCVTYDDVRRFGLLTLIPRARWRDWSRRLGPEPLARSFTARVLRKTLSRSRAPVRSLLLDQRKIAGVGNIYAVEALWFARIHPATPANVIGERATARLHRSVRRVLRRAIRAGGTTLRNYRNAEGDVGRFGRALHAYGRADEPCVRCRTSIERIVFGGRSAFFCPRCQAAPR